MAVYILNFLSIPLYDLLIKNKKKLVILLTIQMFLILALRFQFLGYDVKNYFFYFEHYQTIPAKELLQSLRLFGGANLPMGGHESGFVLFSWFVGTIGLDFHALLIIHSAICMSSTGIFIYRYSKNPALCFAFFVALGGFGYLIGILRQSLAFAIFLFAIPSLQKRRFLRYAFWVLLASLFHTSLLIVLLLYPLSKFSIKKKQLLTISLLCVFIVAFTPFLYDTVLNPILHFLEKSYVKTAFTYNNMFVLMVAMVASMLVFNKNKTTERSVFCWGGVLALLVQATAFHFSIMSRLAIGALLPFLYITVSNVISEQKNHLAKTLLPWGIYVVLLGFYIYTIQDLPHVPYIPCWHPSQAQSLASISAF